MCLFSMRIGINASALTIKEKSGVAVLASELIRAFVPAAEHAGDEVILYAPRELAESDSKQARVRVLSWPFPGWTQVRLAVELLIHPPDVFLDFSNFLPLTLLFTRTQCYYFLHDFSFWEYPNVYPWYLRLLLKIGDGWSRYRAHRIFVSTGAVRSQIARFAPRSVSRLIVLGTGIKTGLIEARKSIEARSNREANMFFDWFGIQKPFFLFVGRMEPKKNLQNTMHGFLTWNTTHEFQLVLVGSESTYVQLLKQRFGEDCRRGDMVFLGYVSELDLARLYDGCKGTVLVSFGEGIGFPILESLFFHKPFLYSSHTRGVSDEYAPYGVRSDSNSPQDIAKAFQKLLEKKISRPPVLNSYAEIGTKVIRILRE